MSEFKVRDRVEVYFGDDKCEGIIKKIRPNDGICEVSLDGYNTLLVTAIDDISRITKEKKKTTLEQLEQRIEKLEKCASMGKYATDRKENVSNFEKMAQKSNLLTEDERVILRNLDKEMYKWIIREENNKLRVYWGKPTKKNGLYWDFTCGYENFYMYNHLFQFIKWTDKEPYNIEELLKVECGNEN